MSLSSKDRGSSRRICMRRIGLTFLLLSSRPVVGSWVDPDTPEEFRSTLSLNTQDDREYQLVFSDEFEQEGRKFHDGSDPRWTAINKNDYTNAALHYYSHDNIRTTNGVLNITTEMKDNVYRAFNEKSKKYYADTKHVQSGMLQGWNKFCFTGGIIEFSAKLPGDPSIGGLWPALWMLGNLARATYVGSSDYVWPFSYNKCNAHKRMTQEINACSKINHYGMFPEIGRGAPEIDVIESMQGEPEKLPSTTIRRPYQSASLQIAPGIEYDRPVLGLKPHKGHWYTDLEYANTSDSKSELNPFFYGVTLVHERKSYTYQADALSANLQLNDTHYNDQHIYRVEWEPPAEDGTGGYIKWYTDNKFIYGLKASSLQITGADIPSEPMYLLINTAVASSWGFPAPCPEGCSCDCFECGNPDCRCALPAGYCDNFPAHFEVEYVRVFQAVNQSTHTLGCSPENRPTDLFIKGHAERYMETGQKRPLEPVQKGGALCRSDEDCGGQYKGFCSPRGFCVCAESFTGPTCLAHTGFYDFESAEEELVEVSSIFLPPSLVGVVIFLLLGFLASMLSALRNKAKKSRYQKLGTSANSVDNPLHGSSASYQNSSDYALPPKQKVVTYSVIDGRLVDP